MTGLSIYALGHLTFEQIAPLQSRFPTIELIDSGMLFDAVLETRGPEINRALAGAANPWIFILREGEQVDAALAAEIGGALKDPPQAWGFRVRTQPMYDGRPLLLGVSAGEVRLVHQRHARLQHQEWKVEGTVIRLREPLRRVTFVTAKEHAEFLQRRGVPHSLLRRMLLFGRNAILTGAWYRSRATLRYLWLEAGYDLESSVIPSV